MKWLHLGSASNDGSSSIEAQHQKQADHGVAMESSRHDDSSAIDTSTTDGSSSHGQVLDNTATAATPAETQQPHSVAVSAGAGIVPEDFAMGALAAAGLGGGSTGPQHMQGVDSTASMGFEPTGNPSDTQPDAEPTGNPSDTQPDADSTPETTTTTGSESGTPADQQVPTSGDSSSDSGSGNSSGVDFALHELEHRLFRLALQGKDSAAEHNGTASSDLDDHRAKQAMYLEAEENMNGLLSPRFLHNRRTLIEEQRRKSEC